MGIELQKELSITSGAVVLNIFLIAHHLVFLRSLPDAAFHLFEKTEFAEIYLQLLKHKTFIRK